MLEFTEEKETLQSCTAEGGTGGPEKTHLWVKGSHSAFHSQKAISFAMEALSSAFACSEVDQAVASPSV